MFKKILFGALVAAGLSGAASEAKAQYPYGGNYYSYRPVYGTVHTYGGHYPHSAYRPYYGGHGCAYTFSTPTYVAPGYGYNTAPVYYGPRGGFTYISPRVGVAIGF